MFFRLTGNISYPLMIVASFLQFPLLLVRYNQPFYHLMVLDLPLLFFSIDFRLSVLRQRPFGISTRSERRACCICRW